MDTDKALRYSAGRRCIICKTGFLKERKERKMYADNRKGNSVGVK